MCPARPRRRQLHLPVPFLTPEKTSFPFVSRVLVAWLESRPGKFAVRASLKDGASQGASRRRRGELQLSDSHSSAMSWSFLCGLGWVFFPSPETGIELLTTGFTAGYLGCVPYFSLLKT